RNKRGISLDLRFERGRELFKELVAKSDVVVENYTRRVMQQYGLEYTDLKAIRSDLIMLSSTGYGHSGPYADYKSLGANTEAMAGLAWLTGYKGDGPRNPGSAFADIVSAHFATLGVLAALIRRRRTGQGAYIDLSQYEASTTFLAEALVAHQQGREVMHQRG